MVERQVLEAPPSPESAALLLGLAVPGLPADDARAVVLACEKVVRAVQAVQAEAMVAAAGPVPEPDPDSGREPLDTAAEWLAVDLGGSRQFQLARIDTARFLRRWLPRTCAAMAAGMFGWYEAGLLVRAAQGLTRPELIGRLEDRIVPGGTSDLARRIRRAVARIDPAAVERKKQQARSGRRLEFFRDRFGDGTAGLAGSAASHLVALIAAAIDLDARPQADGDCRTLDMRRFDVLADWARQRLGLPTEDTHPTRDSDAADTAGAATAARHAAQALLAYASHHDPDQTPADMASTASHPDTAPAEGQPETAPTNGHPDLAPANSHPEMAPADGHPAAPLAPAAPPGDPVLHRGKRCTSCGRTGPPTLPINVTVSLDTLLGLSAEPADLPGWGLLDPDTARTLAADGTWRRWLCEPDTGALLDLGATTYRPNERLAHHVRSRDRTCRWPNCNRPAVDCDLDHTESFDHDHPDEGGPTTRANLAPLCRRHHRHKHETDATYTRTPNGGTRWKDPHGRTHTRPPERHHTDWTDWPAQPADVAGPTEPSEPEEPRCPF